MTEVLPSATSTQPTDAAIAPVVGAATAAAIQSIPLSKLIVSEQNIRRIDRKADLDALAASIRSLGLLQNLTVTADDHGRCKVIAGGRRLAALKALAKQGAIARDYRVPCQVVDAAAAVEISLAENVQRVATDAMDEVEAFAALRDQGFTVIAIAQRFGIAVRHVEQRLALAALSPKLKAAYRKGDLALEAAWPFCMASDHARQEAVFKALAKPVTHAGQVRAHLSHGRMRNHDRLARFVGIEAYEAAGGSLTRDLFLDSEVYVDDPSLIAQSAHAKLEPLRADLLARGWAWVNIHLDGRRFDSQRPIQLSSKRRPPSPSEAQRLEDLETAIAALEEALAEAADDDPRWVERDLLDDDYQALSQALVEWDTAEMALAGVDLCVEHDGRLSTHYGLVAKADAAKLAKLQRQRSATDTIESADAARDHGAAAEPPPWRQPRATLPRALVRALTAARATAIRNCLLDQPMIALAIGVFGLSRGLRSGHSAPGIGFSAQPHWSAAQDRHGAAGDCWLSSVPEAETDLLDWCLAQDGDTLLATLAQIVAAKCDFAHEDADIDDRRKQSLADRIAAALDLDMTRHWTADLSFWSRVPKAGLLDALAHAPCALWMTPADRRAFLKTAAKRTKDDLAKTVAEALAGTGWLPALLTMPRSDSRCELTQAGQAAIADLV